MENLTLTQGTIVQFTYEHDGHTQEDNQFILAECFESNYSFQIICIKGYHSGCVEGYVENEIIKGPISFQHLKKELNRNFQKILWNSFEIIVAHSPS